MKPICAIFLARTMNAILRAMKASKEKGNSTYVRYIGELPEGVAVML